jgi:hypothetical protein
MSELKGLARSFDTLFLALAESEQGIVSGSESVAPAMATGTEEPAHSDEIVRVDELMDPFEPGMLVELKLAADPEPTVGAELVTEPESFAEAELAAEPEPFAEVAPSAEPIEPIRGALETGVGDEGASAPFDDVVEELAAIEVVEEPAQLVDTGEHGEDEFVPTPLDLATEEFIAGDASRSDDIESLAERCLDQRELDPVARAVTAITLASGDPPDPSMYAVAEAIMSGPVLGRLASRMGRERDEERRTEYFAVCRTIGADMAVAIRADLADNTDRLARRIHCQALVGMGEPGRAVIEEMAVDENRFLVRNAVSILGDQGGGRAVELCTSALANPDARVRKEALRSLAKLGDPESGQIIVGLLDDPDAEVRIAAAVAAGELRAERALKPLIAMLDAAKDPDEALPLIRALGRIADPGAVASIEKHTVPSLFVKPRADVRIACYRALNEIGTPHARRLLNQAINDKDTTVKSAVKAILGIR